MVESSSNEEIYNYIKTRPFFPCILKTNENDEIETNMNFLKKIDPQKVNFVKENSLEIKNIQTEQSMHGLNQIKISSDISFYVTETAFKKELENLKKTYNKLDLIVGEYKTYSFNINESDISFMPSTIEEISFIANQNITDEEKAKDLEDLFEDKGFFIPLKIYIGGKFVSEYIKQKTDKIRDSQLDLENKTTLPAAETPTATGDLSVSKYENINILFSNKNTKIIGGDFSKKTVDDWKLSVNLENSNIIRYSNLISVRKIIPLELRNKLQTPLQMIENKYKIRKKYIEMVKSLKDTEFVPITDSSNFQKGFCKEKNEKDEPTIYLIQKQFKTHRSFMNYTTKTYKENFDDIIVGFKIIDNKKRGNNGTFTIDTNPLLKKEIIITLVSKFYRGVKFLAEIYLMKLPK